MLHETGELAEFGDVFAKQIHLVHGAQNGRDAAALVEDGQKGLPHVRIIQKSTVYQRKFIANELHQVGVQRQLPLLRVKKNAHQALGLFPENAPGRGANFAADK